MDIFDDETIEHVEDDIELMRVSQEKLRIQAAQSLVTLAGVNPEMADIPRHLEDKQNQ